MEEQFARTTSRALFWYFRLFSTALIVASVFVAPIETLWSGFLNILLAPSGLTVCSVAVGGLNGALLNAGLLGLIVVALLKLSHVEASGVSIGAFFLTAGFGFFGKDCLNIWPFVLGVWCYAKVKRAAFSQYAHFALFAAALSPVVSEMLFNRLFQIPLVLGIPLAVVLGALLGFLIPPLSAHTATIHKGYNLFNVGLSAGLLGTLFFAIYQTFVLRPRGLESDFELHSILVEGYPLFFSVFFCVIFLVTLTVGFLMNNRSFTGYWGMLRSNGYHADFTKLYEPGLIFINIGCLGLLSIGYFLLIGAPFSGPTVGSLLCICCWAGNGSTPRNTLPIFIGYALVSIFADWSLSTQSICVGICFATGLSPISGRWGFLCGVVAGGMHACLVPYTVQMHGGFNIYNGGFTSGITAAILVPLLESFVPDIDARRAARKARKESNSLVM